MSRADYYVCWHAIRTMTPQQRLFEYAWAKGTPGPGVHYTARWAAAHAWHTRETLIHYWWRPGRTLQRRNILGPVGFLP